MKLLEDSPKLYNDGYSIKEIAEITNLSYEILRKYLKNKVKWRKNYISDLNENDVKDILKLFDDGKPIHEIAKLYNYSSPAISKLLKAHNKKIISTKRKYDLLREVPLNNFQKQIIIGSILGDGCVSKHSEKGAYLSFSHSIKQKEYFYWKKAYLDPFINNDYLTKDNCIQCKTIVHKELNKYLNLFYTKDRIKIIPKNIDLYLSPLALAIWIMDDGNLNAGVNMRIATMSFTYEENELLKNALKSVFDLNAKVMGFKYRDKQYWQITLNKFNTAKLSNIVRPYIIESMKYKIMSPESSTTTCQTTKDNF